MSVGRRAYDLLRGYVNREWERLHEGEIDDAYNELNQDLAKPIGSQTSTSGSSSLTQSLGDPAANRSLALKTLGVAEGASFHEIRKAFERLSKRSDPERFLEGSVERSQAEEIHRRVDWAYRQLTDGIDDSQKRFGSLEIE